MVEEGVVVEECAYISGILAEVGVWRIGEHFAYTEGLVPTRLGHLIAKGSLRGERPAMAYMRLLRKQELNLYMCTLGAENTW